MDCPICMDTIDDNQSIDQSIVTSTPCCKYKIHKRCFEACMKVKMACPMCRASIGPCIPFPSPLLMPHVSVSIENNQQGGGNVNCVYALLGLLSCVVFIVFIILYATR
jgi:hypothetical protein